MAFVPRTPFFVGKDTMVPVYSIIAGDVRSPRPQKRRIIKIGAGIVVYDPFTHYQTVGEFLKNTAQNIESIIQIVLLGQTEEDQIIELESILKALQAQPAIFQKSTFCLDIAHCDIDTTTADTITKLFTGIRALGRPCLISVSVLIPPKDIAQLLTQIPVDGVIVSEAIPVLALTSEAKHVFFRTTSPRVPQGGYIVGKYSIPLVGEWIDRFRKHDPRTQIIATGVLRKRDVRALRDAGAQGLLLGSIGLVRPWNTKSVAMYAKRVFV